MAKIRELTVRYSYDGILEVGKVVEREAIGGAVLDIIKETFIANEGRRVNLKKYQSTRRIEIIYDVTINRSKWIRKDYYLNIIQECFEEKKKMLGYEGGYYKIPYGPNISIRPV